MEVIGYLYGGGPVIKRYHAGTTISTRGIQILGAVDAATDLGSVEPGTTSTAINVGSQVGINLDTSGTIGATGTTAAGILISILVRPDAIIKGKMVAGSTADTALTAQACTAASATGVIATGVTSMDNGCMWGYDGANQGVVRRTDDTSGGVAINFPNAIASGDRFLAANGYPCGCELTNFECYDLTTNLDQIDATTLITDMDNFVTFDLDVKGQEDSGASNSYYHLIANNHLFGSSSLA